MTTPGYGAAGAAGATGATSAAGRRSSFSFSVPTTFSFRPDGAAAPWGAAAPGLWVAAVGFRKEAADRALPFLEAGCTVDPRAAFGRASVFEAEPRGIAFMPGGGPRLITCTIFSR